MKIYIYVYKGKARLNVYSTFPNNGFSVDFKETYNDVYNCKVLGSAKDEGIIRMPYSQQFLTLSQFTGPAVKVVLSCEHLLN